jgi:hypothetical protein
MRRELETGLRRLLHGHEGGNPGHSQGVSYELPHQFPTLPPHHEVMYVEKSGWSDIGEVLTRPAV